MHYRQQNIMQFLKLKVGYRMELKLPVKEYGLIVDGDEWQLSFQGTRFKVFEREYK